MMQITADRRNRSRAGVRLLLSLLLVFAPLLATATGMPLLAAGGDGPTLVSGEMPCHPAAAEPIQSVQHDACPHCMGEGPASQCHCHGYAAPAGLSFHTDILSDRHPDGPPPHVVVTDPLPDSPDNRLYRPPIAHS